MARRSQAVHMVTIGPRTGENGRPIIYGVPKWMTHPITTTTAPPHQILASTTQKRTQEAETVLHAQNLTVLIYPEG